MTQNITPTSIQLRLQTAGWAPSKCGNWTHPERKGPHCYLVALVLSDLPRIKWDSGTFETLIPVGIGQNQANGRPAKYKKAEKVGK